MFFIFFLESLDVHVSSGLSSDLDKLSPGSVKYLFVGYSRTQKRYQYYNRSTMKYYVFVDFTFF